MGNGKNNVGSWKIGFVFINGFAMSQAFAKLLMDELFTVAAQTPFTRFFKLVLNELLSMSIA